MKKVLFVAHLFPPSGGGGVQRSLKFVKYLPEFAWQPTVLCAAEPRPPEDPHLQAEVPPQTTVIPVRGLPLPSWLPWRARRWITRWLLTVDPEIGWLPSATRCGRGLLAEHPFDALFSTSSPYTSHLVGLRLHKLSGLPWIADFRDPWTDNINAHFPTPAHRSACVRLEAAVLRNADRVVVVSEPMCEQFLARHGQLSRDKFITLPNGFDPADFEGVGSIPRDNRFLIVSTGSIYGRRTARPFLSALRVAVDRRQLSPSEISVRFVGNVGREAPALVLQWNLASVVEFCGYRPHREAIAHQLGADALLLLIGGGPGSQVVLTGKVFEYLAAEKPILALIPPGAAADLLEEVGTEHIVPPDDVDAIVSSLVRLVGDWKNGRPMQSPAPEIMARYDRRLQARELAKLLDRSTSRSVVGPVDD